MNFNFDCEMDYVYKIKYNIIRPDFNPAFQNISSFNCK